MRLYRVLDMLNSFCMASPLVDAIIMWQYVHTESDPIMAFSFSLSALGAWGPLTASEGAWKGQFEASTTKGWRLPSFFCKATKTHSHHSF
jgi:hypothetical protein